MNLYGGMSLDQFILAVKTELGTVFPDHTVELDRINDSIERLSFNVSNMNGIGANIAQLVMAANSFTARLEDVATKLLTNEIVEVLHKKNSELSNELEELKKRLEDKEVKDAPGQG